MVIVGFCSGGLWGHDAAEWGYRDFCGHVLGDGLAVGKRSTRRDIARRTTVPRKATTECCSPDDYLLTVDAGL